jgi:hypothetical protein
MSIATSSKRHEQSSCDGALNSQWNDAHVISCGDESIVAFIVDYESEDAVELSQEHGRIILVLLVQMHDALAIGVGQELRRLRQIGAKLLVVVDLNDDAAETNSRATISTVNQVCTAVSCNLLIVVPYLSIDGEPDIARGISQRLTAAL